MYTSWRVDGFTQQTHDTLDAVLTRLRQAMAGSEDVLAFLKGYRSVPLNLMVTGTRFNLTGPLSLPVICLLLTGLGLGPATPTIG